MSRPINEMLLQSWRLPPQQDGGQTLFLLEVFPFWPAEEPASFTTLLAKGGFEVSAAYSGASRTVVGGVDVRAKHTVLDAPTSRALLVNPWGGGTHASVTCDANPVPVEVTPEGWLAWDSPKGVVCTVAMA